MKRECVECCPVCGGENILMYDIEQNGYEAKCEHCGAHMFLCDECFHSGDNIGRRCDWHDVEGVEGGVCFRKSKLMNVEAFK